MNVQWWRSIVSMLTLIMLSISPVGAATDQEVASVMAGGQKYLLDTFVQDPVDATQGYWTSSGSSSPSLSDTAAAVAALIETGKYGEASYKAQIDKAVKYLLTNVKTDGGIYESTWEATYLTGLNLVALSLYGQQASVDAAFDTVIRNAVDYLVTRQSLDGGWTYNPTAATTYSDMSNTQFGVMGVYYGSSYLHIPINADTAGSWAAKLYAFVQQMQHADGHCAYYNYGTSISDYTNESMTGACLWSLAMIGKGNSPEAVKAINWFASNYRWTLGNSKDYYFVYAMAKALAGTVGAGNSIGTAPAAHDWLTDLKDTLFTQAVPGAAGTDQYTWADQNWLTSYPRLTVAFNLMSLTFADPNQGSPSKLLPEQPDSDIPAPNQGLVRLETTGGVTISVPSRGLISAGTTETGVELPIGSFNFTLNGLTSATTVLRIVPPLGSLDPNNSINGFLNADGTIKAGLTWFKLADGAWKGLADVPIKLGPEGGPYTYIEVTLTDNGKEDTDATVGVIRDPGAPGVGFVASADEPVGGSGNCFIATAAYGSNMAADVMLLRKFRDSVLLTNAFGRMLVDTYYAVSPPIAAFIADHAILRATTRAALAPIIFTVKYPWGSLGILILAGLFAGFVVRRQGNAS